MKLVGHKYIIGMDYRKDNILGGKRRNAPNHHLAVRIIHSLGNADDILGHIGGDDYVVLTSPDRAETIAHISGKLHLEEACGFSLRCVVHCGSSIQVGKYSVVGEYASVMDGEHVHIQTDDYWFYGDPQAKTVLKPVKIGKGAYIGAKATIAMGVEIGDFSRIGANSLVLRSIEPHRLAVGVPARPIMELE